MSHHHAISQQDRHELRTILHIRIAHRTDSSELCNHIQIYTVYTCLTGLNCFVEICYILDLRSFFGIRGPRHL